MPLYQTSAMPPAKGLLFLSRYKSLGKCLCTDAMNVVSGLRLI